MSLSKLGIGLPVVGEVGVSGCGATVKYRLIFLRIFCSGDVLSLFLLEFISLGVVVGLSVVGEVGVSGCLLLLGFVDIL